MRIKTIAWAMIILALSACDARTEISSPVRTPIITDSPTTEVHQTVAPDAIHPPKVSPIVSGASAVQPSLQDSSPKKEDNSIRAIGTLPDGRLLVKPASKAIVATLDTPSCLGLETDLSWTGDYEAVWEAKSNGALSKVMIFPLDFGIVQKNDAPVKMQEFTLGGTEILAYVPRYTDCHGLETYLFGVTKGKAFPITFEMKPDQIWTNLSQLPHRPFQVAKGEFILTGGYGAGQDFIKVYHFHYDPKKQSMILQSTDQVKPNDIVYD